MKLGCSMPIVSLCCSIEKCLCQHLPSSQSNERRTRVAFEPDTRTSVDRKAEVTVDRSYHYGMKCEQFLYVDGDQYARIDGTIASFNFFVIHTFPDFIMYLKSFTDTSLRTIVSVEQC